MSVLVVGSFMMDLVTRCHRAPNPGETVIGKSFNTYLGGKGANQAVAAARLESDVIMVGMVGRDDFGQRFIEFFRSLPHMDATNIKQTNVSTGVGSITLDSTGQNKIVVVPGANMEYLPEDLEKLENAFQTANVVVCQLEMRMDVIKKASEMAKKFNKIFILNPAPFQKLDPDLLKNVDYLTPNESELAGLTGKSAFESQEDLLASARMMIDAGVCNVIVTMGEKGALHVTKNQIKLHEAFKVEAIDTVAAGDAFNGALAASLDQNKPIEVALRYANAAGGLAVQKSGAIPSLPDLDTIEVFLKNH
ncbi:MAG: ribokinase [Bacilli bacterium]|nr:ribokinase [Bacilli bacterium]